MKTVLGILCLGIAVVVFPLSASAGPTPSYVTECRYVDVPLTGCGWTVRLPRCWTKCVLTGFRDPSIGPIPCGSLGLGFLGLGLPAGVVPDWGPSAKEVDLTEVTLRTGAAANVIKELSREFSVASHSLKRPYIPSSGPAAGIDFSPRAGLQTLCALGASDFVCTRCQLQPNDPACQRLIGKWAVPWSSLGFGATR